MGGGHSLGRFMSSCLPISPPAMAQVNKFLKNSTKEKWTNQRKVLRKQTINEVERIEELIFIEPLLFAKLFGVCFTLKR
jgi:hypothetical protein